MRIWVESVVFRVDSPILRNSLVLNVLFLLFVNPSAFAVNNAHLNELNNITRVIVDSAASKIGSIYRKIVTINHTKIPNIYVYSK